MSPKEPLPREFKIENLRKWTAVKITAATGFDYFSILELLQKWNVHGNWTDWELENRPVNIEELAGLVSEEFERSDV